MTLSVEAIEAAKEFANFRIDENRDYTLHCQKCNRHYDYRIFLTHRCVPEAERHGYVRTIT
jgi:hypothetical protein